LGRLVLRSAVLVVCMHWAFGMVCRIFRSFDGGRFQSLIGVGQFLDAFLRGVFYV
jgi:hypothetical protein